MAGEGAGVLSDLGPIATATRASSTQVSPHCDAAERERLCRRWDRAVDRCLQWHGDGSL